MSAGWNAYTGPSDPIYAPTTRPPTFAALRYDELDKINRDAAVRSVRKARKPVRVPVR